MKVVSVERLRGSIECIIKNSRVGDTAVIRIGDGMEIKKIYRSITCIRQDLRFKGEILDCVKKTYDNGLVEYDLAF